MTKIICHRGNIYGKNEKRENQPVYILEAINAGYDVEIDVWMFDGKLYLGHDRGEYQIDLEFLRMDQLWCHCKNLETLNYLINENIHCFYHSEDLATLTSRSIIWLYPGIRPVTQNSVVVLPEKSDYTDQELSNAYALCTDKADYYKNKLGL